jgi:hypothetical protein
MLIEFLKILLIFAVLFAAFSVATAFLYGIRSLYSPDYIHTLKFGLLVYAGFSVFYGAYVAIYNRLMRHGKPR